MYLPSNHNFFRNFYTGVGSRETPLYIMYMMSKLAMILEKQGFVLRSGCATGADAAFEDALENPSITSEIYIPNKNFPTRMHTSYKNHYLIPKNLDDKKGTDSLFSQAMQLIHRYNIHKAWQHCPLRFMELHNRNMFQVLGKDLNTRSKFTICYTRKGEKTYQETDQKTGGTATAINASDIFKVRIFNLGNDADYLRLKEFIKTNEMFIDYDRLNKIKPRTDINSRNKSTYFDFLETIKDEEIKRENKINNLSNNKLKI